MRIVVFGFLIAVLGGFSRSSEAASWCQPDKTPNISIKTSTDQISYDFSKSEKQLNGFGVTTINPYGEDVITDVGGLMKGGIITKQKMTFGTMTNGRLGQICFWHDSIDVMIHIKPTIFIATEFPQGTCMHNSIMGHEQKHVVVDREIVNKYAALIGRAMQADVAQFRLFGPFPAAQQEAALATVRNRMQAILKQYTDQMSAERKQRQQAVDNIGEYERVNKSCGKR